MNPIRVLIVDDHALVRAGIRALVEKIDGDYFAILGLPLLPLLDALRREGAIES